MNNLESKLGDLVINPKEITNFLNKAINSETIVTFTKDGDFLHNYSGNKSNVRKIIKTFEDFEYFDDTTLKDVLDLAFKYKFELEKYFELKKEEENLSDVEFISRIIGLFVDEKFIDSEKSFDFYNYYVNYYKEEVSKRVYKLLKVDYQGKTLNTNTLVSYNQIGDFENKIKEFSIYFPDKDNLELILNIIGPKFLYELMSHKDINTNDLVYDVFENIKLKPFREILNHIGVDGFYEVFQKMTTNFTSFINSLEDVEEISLFLENYKKIDYDTLASLNPSELDNFVYLFSKIKVGVFKIDSQKLFFILTSNFMTEFKKYLKGPHIFQKSNTQYFNDFLEDFIGKK